MLNSRRGGLSRSSGRWVWLPVVTVLSAAVVLFALSRPTPGPARESLPVSPTAEPTFRSSAETSPSPMTEPTTAATVQAPAGAPSTTDFRKLATAAATLIYSWDTRSASYSDVYSRLRSWWHVLPDGSNPLAVLVQEFEATGINAGSYTSLAGQQAFRSATVQSLKCDGELAKVRERPAPWVGLHVCTVSVRVVDQAAASRNTYTAPVSVMVNCPPAPTAPADRCVMVGFYATPDRIVY